MSSSKFNFNSENYVFFILSPEKKNNAIFGFRAEYTDRNGDIRRVYLDRIDRNTGDKMIKKYSIQKGHGSLRVYKGQEEELKFLREHPNCKDSINGFYRDDGTGNMIQTNVWFSELNSEREAKEGLKAKEFSLKAANSVMDISKDEEKLSMLGAIMGYTGSPNEMLFKLIEHAQKMPSEVLNEIENPTFKAKALFRKGVSKKVIIQRGITYMLEDFELGIDEDSSVKTIFTNKDVEALLIKKLDNS